MSEFRDKLRSIGFSTRRGTTERRAVLNEDTGKVGGYQIEHWDGSQDAEVHLETLRLEIKKEEMG